MYENVKVKCSPASSNNSQTWTIALGNKIHDSDDRFHDTRV